MYRYITILLGWSIIALSQSTLFAQSPQGVLEGTVVEKTSDGKEEAIPCAQIFWAGTSIGSISGPKGEFKLDRVKETNLLVIRLAGYPDDTLDIKGKTNLVIEINSAELEGVEITSRQKTTRISRFDPLKVETISSKELLKAACCNLSESFETSPSVDVAFTDAVTGTRQIQMLGLAGPYIQITRENIPDVRGLAAIYGLTYTPGTWIEGIQLNKGTGSVVNGFESIAGQINVELQKPEEMDKLYLNLYGNMGGRGEINAHSGIKLSEKWYTGILVHGQYNFVKNDRNKDGFLDNPVGPHLIAMNRWKYFGNNGIRAQFGIKGVYANQIGGQKAFDPKVNEGGTDFWGMNLNQQRLEGFAKLGKVYEDRPWRSFGSQLSVVGHKQKSYFGLNKYDAKQYSVYGNALYQSMFSNTSHKFKTGVSIMYDEYEETHNSVNYDRTEIVPGAFFEYSYKFAEKFDIVAGVRGDYHNLYGFFATPRLHMRWSPIENTVIRASAGRGQRTANIFAENNGLFASSREIRILGDGGDTPYGLQPEVAWNYGLNFTQFFELDYRDGSVTVDFYRTDFQNQIVMDLDHSPQQAVFYNLQGQSFSNSLQVQADYEVIKRLDVRLAYRWYDVRTSYDGVLLAKPLLAGHRAFINMGYETKNHWKFDYTLNWIGEKRIPNTSTNPEPYRLSEKSPSYFLMNAQISKSWLEKIEVYLGGENLLNVRQKDAILANDNPFGDFFDSSLIWGPVFGANVYAGIRYTVF